MTLKELDELEYGEYHFRKEYLREERQQEEKNNLIAASFTAWQLGTLQGLKVSWKKYLKDLNLLESEKVSKEESKKTAEVAMRILKKLGKV